MFFSCFNLNLLSNSSSGEMIFSPSLKQSNRYNLMAPSLIPFKWGGEGRRTTTFLLCMCCHFPVTSDESGLTTWQIPSWINQSTHFISSDFETSNIVISSHSEKKLLFYFRPWRNWFSLGFKLFPPMHAYQSPRITLNIQRWTKEVGILKKTDKNGKWISNVCQDLHLLVSLSFFCFIVRFIPFWRFYFLFVFSSYNFICLTLVPSVSFFLISLPRPSAPCSPASAASTSLISSRPFRPRS